MNTPSSVVVVGASATGPSTAEAPRRRGDQARPDTGEVLPADVVMVAIGTDPATGWLAGSAKIHVHGLLPADADVTIVAAMWRAAASSRSTAGAVSAGHRSARSDTGSPVPVTCPRHRPDRPCGYDVAGQPS